MKKFLKQIGLIALVAVIAFSMAVCDDGGGGIPGSGGNNGTTNVPVTGVTLNESSISMTEGDTETLIATVTPNNATNKAVSWSTSNAAVATVANGVVNSVGAGSATITVTTVDGGKTAACSVTVADGDSGKTYALGDIGPGGGKIFYYSEEGFTMTDNDQLCHYLEAAPSNSFVTKAWSTKYTRDNVNVAGTEAKIGSGRKNTALILAADAAAAADYCKSYRNKSGGKTDWFLPSKNELNELYKNRALAGAVEQDYWSSTQAGKDMAWYQKFYVYYQYGETYDGEQASSYKYYEKVARPIRAF